MKKIITFLFVVGLLSACGYHSAIYTGEYNNKMYLFDTPVKTKLEATAKAKEMYEAEQKAAEEARLKAEEARKKAEEEARKKAEAEKIAAEREEKERQAEIKANFEKAYSKLLNGKCSTDQWNAYPFGEYFTSLAKENKITPWQVANGTSYERRNISSFVFSEISDNYIKLLVYHFPEEISLYFRSLPPEEQAPIFNAIVKKYNTCYHQLK